MKKILIVLSLIISIFLLASCGNGAAAEKHDFRNVDFGMSTIELFEIEGEPDDDLIGDDLSIYYYKDREAFGVKNALIEYHIDKNGIGWVSANFQNEYADNKSYITEYNTIKKNLIAVWGEPDNITENEEEFNFICTWENKSLFLNRNSEDEAFLRVVACSSDYLELSLERIQENQKERQDLKTKE